MTRGAALVVAVLATSGCRTLHEGAIRQRLVETRLAATPLPLSEGEVRARLGALPTVLVEPLRPGTCPLCVVSIAPAPAGGTTYCFVSGADAGCLVLTGEGEGRSRLRPPGADGVPASIARGVWGLLDPPAAVAAAELSDDELAALALEEEQAFTPRWSFVAGAKSGAVVSFDRPSFTFGGQAGVRYWGSPFVLPGAALEAEALLQGGRVRLAVCAQGRMELSLWRPDNARAFNLPAVAFLMAVGPLVGFGVTGPALGARAVIGLSLTRVGPIPTPFFFEMGFQALEVDAERATGLRVALGLGY